MKLIKFIMAMLLCLIISTQATDIQAAVTGKGTQESAAKATQEVNRFTVFCDNPNPASKSDCDKMLNKVYQKYILDDHIYQNANTISTKLSMKEKMDLIKQKLTRKGKWGNVKWPEDDEKHTYIYGVESKHFNLTSKFEPLSIENVPEHLQHALKKPEQKIKESITEHQFSVHFLVGPSAVGKSTITSSIGGLIKNADRDAKIIRIDGDDFREGYAPYQELIDISRNFNCGTPEAPKYCVYNWWEVKAFTNLKEDYFSKLYDTYEGKAHLIVPETPTFNPFVYSNAMTKVVNNDKYQKLFYNIIVKSSDVDHIREAGEKRAELSGKQYKSRDQAFWSMFLTKPSTWANNPNKNGPTFGTYTINYEFNRHGFKIEQLKKALEASEIEMKKMQENIKTLVEVFAETKAELADQRKLILRILQNSKSDYETFRHLTLSG